MADTSHPYIQILISRIPRSMGSYAPILKEVEAVLSNSQSNLLNVGEVIERDPDLTARLLRLGNSSFYGFPSRLATVSEAISLIGIQQVQDLIVASSVVEAFAGVSPEFVNMESFWKHSLACGVGARLLAIARRVPKPDKFFVAGLLHDIGRLVLFSQAPQKAQRVFQLYRSRRMLLCEAESQVLEFDHTAIGEALLRAWHYPSNLIDAVSYHHQPMLAGAFQTEAAFVHIADHLVNAMQLGSSGERFVPPLQMNAWEKLNLTPDILEPLMHSMEDQLEAVQEAFLGTREPTSGP
jgi:HD-like signal output (HDOD) protein